MSEALPAARPRKVDIHTHLLPPELPRWKEKFGYGGFIGLEHSGEVAHSCGARMVRDDGRFFRDVESNLWSPSARLQDCEAHGVDLQVLSTVPVMFSYWAKAQDGLEVARFLNDHLAEAVATRPDRFAGLGTLPMQDPDLSCRELERCVRTLGLQGVQIGSHVGEKNLSDPDFYPVFAEAERLGACLFVHPWDMMGESRMTKYWLPWLVGMPAEVSLAICSMIFGGIFEKFPRLRVAFAHGGGAFPHTIGRIQHGFEARPDLCAVDNPIAPREYLKRFYVDSLVHDPLALRYLVDLFGADRIALGTDYPFPLGELEPGRLIETLPNLSTEERERMLAGTALEWLGGRFEKFTPSDKRGAP